MPSSFVVAVVSLLVSMFLIVTVAPGIAAPFGSVTLPVTEPRNSCALAVTNRDRSNNAARIPWRNICLYMSLSFQIISLAAPQ